MAFSHQAWRFARLERLQINFRPTRLVGGEREPPAVRRERRVSFVKRCADQMNDPSPPGDVDQPHVAL